MDDVRRIFTSLKKIKKSNNICSNNHNRQYIVPYYFLLIKEGKKEHREVDKTKNTRSMNHRYITQIKSPHTPATVLKTTTKAKHLKVARLSLFTTRKCLGCSSFRKDNIPFEQKED